MNPARLIPSAQSGALAREVERRFKNETGAVIAAAERDARAVVAQAHAAARHRVHEAIQELRREGARRLTQTKAQIEAERRSRALRQATQAIGDALPLLREELDARWRDRRNRRQWTDAIARLCILRLRPGAWLVEHPPDWIEPEQRDFMAAIRETHGGDISFEADSHLKSGLRIKADQAVLDATSQGLLADSRAIAALILDEIGKQ